MMTMKQGITDALLLPAEQVAGLLQISVRTLWRMVSAGDIPYPVRLGRSVRWRAEEMRQWIEAGCPKRTEWDRKGR